MSLQPASLVVCQVLQLQCHSLLSLLPFLVVLLIGQILLMWAEMVMVMMSDSLRSVPSSLFDELMTKGEKKG